MTEEEREAGTLLGTIAIPASVVRHVGPGAALLLADIAEEWAYRYVEDPSSLRDGMVYRSISKMEERTGLTEKAQRIVIQSLIDGGYIRTQALNVGMTKRRYFELAHAVKKWALALKGNGRPLPEDDSTDLPFTAASDLPHSEPAEKGAIEPAVKGVTDAAVEGGNKNGTTRRTDNPITVVPPRRKTAVSKRSHFKGEEAHHLMLGMAFVQQWVRWLEGSQGARNTSLEWRMALLNELMELPAASAIDNVRFAADQRRAGISTINHGSRTNEPRRTQVDLADVKRQDDEYKRAAEEIRRRRDGATTGTSRGLAAPAPERPENGQGHSGGNGDVPVARGEVEW